GSANIKCDVKEEGQEDEQKVRQIAEDGANADERANGQADGNENSRAARDALDRSDRTRLDVDAAYHDPDRVASADGAGYVIQ
ncbi:UNVERIFIED_CONTAM: hypothetical protein NY603_34770, partial [Bacteroidetes bacterium 56_B9]